MESKLASKFKVWSMALIAMRNGYKIRRSDWPQGVFAQAVFDEDRKLVGMIGVEIVNSDGTIKNWIPSMADQKAEWEVLPMESGR